MSLHIQADSNAQLQKKRRDELQVLVCFAMCSECKCHTSLSELIIQPVTVFDKLKLQVLSCMRFHVRYVEVTVHVFLCM